jgi:hypothetical protein
VRCARFRLRSIYDAPTHYGFKVLPRQALTDLKWWRDFSYEHASNSAPIFPPVTTRTLFADASGTTGWGAELRGPGPPRVAQGYWTPAQRGMHITFKELVTLRFAFLALAPELAGQHVLLFEDNMAVCHIVRAGSTRSPEMMHELRLLWALMDRLHITIHVQYVRSADNAADKWSRMRSRSAWQLDPKVFRRLQRRYGRRFTLDAFACAATAQLPRYCALKADPFALSRDAFSLDWSTEDLFLNPPWKELPRVLSKLRRGGGRGVLIVPEWPSQLWYPTMLQLAQSIVPLPRPSRCVRLAHDGPVEPFLHAKLKLLAVFFDTPVHDAPATSMPALAG